MLDLDADPCPLNKAFYGRRANVNRGSSRGWDRDGQRTGGHRHRVHTGLLVQVAESVPVRVARPRVEHEVVEIQGVGSAPQAGGAEEANRNPDEFRVLPVGGGKVQCGIPREVGPHAEAARRGQDDVRLRRPAKGELPA